MKRNYKIVDNMYMLENFLYLLLNTRLTNIFVNIQVKQYFVKKYIIKYTTAKLFDCYH